MHALLLICINQYTKFLASPTTKIWLEFQNLKYQSRDADYAKYGVVWLILLCKTFDDSRFSRSKDMIVRVEI